VGRLKDLTRGVESPTGPLLEISGENAFDAD